MYQLWLFCGEREREREDVFNSVMLVQTAAGLCAHTDTQKEACSQGQTVRRTLSCQESQEVIRKVKKPENICLFQ